MERIAVTTSADRFAGMASELVAVGLHPVPVPCVIVKEASRDVLFRAAAAAEEADLIVLTSSRPLDLLWDGEVLPDTPFAVVGPAVAADVSSKGGTIAMVGEGSALGMADALQHEVGNSNVVFPHAAGTDPRVIVTLKEAARSMLAIPIYCSVPRSTPTERHIDAAVFLSSTAVEGWAQHRDFDDVTVACLGAATEGALRRHLRSPEVVCLSSTYSDLAGSLAGWFHP